MGTDDLTGNVQLGMVGWQARYKWALRREHVLVVASLGISVYVQLCIEG
jgi:hypothetical protein